MFKKIKLLFIMLVLFSFSVQAQQVNPKYTFFAQGDTPSAWQWVLSDPTNWWLPINTNTGASGSGKITIEPSDDKTFAGAVKVSWGKAPVWGGVSIAGLSTNLAAFENRAEIILAVKLEKRGEHVDVKMACGENCEGSINISEHLKNAKLNKWFALPMPLNCFSQQGADLSKINIPFAIGTSSDMVLHIAEIRVSAMKSDDTGCLAITEPVSE